VNTWFHPEPDKPKTIVQSKICFVVVIVRIFDNDYDNENDFFDSLFKTCEVRD